MMLVMLLMFLMTALIPRFVRRDPSGQLQPDLMKPSELAKTKGITGSICKKAMNSANNGSGVCNHHSGSSGTGLEKWLEPTNTGHSSAAYTTSMKERVTSHDAGVISGDIRENLTKGQKGVVSSAFAKAHEGAEIVEIRSISTTSVMVNACYDVLTDGLPVSPYGCAGSHQIQG